MSGDVRVDGGGRAIRVGHRCGASRCVVVKRSHELTSATDRDEVVSTVVRERLRCSIRIRHTDEIAGRRVAVVDVPTQRQFG